MEEPKGILQFITNMNKHTLRYMASTGTEDYKKKIII